MLKDNADIGLYLRKNGFYTHNRANGKTIGVLVSSSSSPNGYKTATVKTWEDAKKLVEERQLNWDTSDVKVIV